MTPHYITDYTYYFSNDECDPDFHFWSALTLLGHVMGRRIFVSHGRFKFYPNLYTMMVGTAGSGKSTARKEAKKLYIELFPDLLISESVQSREDIVAEMVDNVVWYEDKTKQSYGKKEEYRPFFLSINELDQFISVSPVKMLGFLVDIFDEDNYGVGFKKDKELGKGKQRVKHPHVSLLSCCPPEWFMDNIKGHLFSGGLGRRSIILYRQKTKLNDNPVNPPDSLAGWQRVKEHLIKMGSVELCGEIQKTPEAQRWYSAWHNDPKRLKRYDDPVLRQQLLETQHVLLYKIAMLFCCSRYNFDFILTEEDFTNALRQLHNLEADIAKLMSTSGKNEMAPTAELMLQAIDAAGGYMTAARLLTNFYRHSQDMRAYREGVDFLVDVGKILKVLLKLPRFDANGQKIKGPDIEAWYVVSIPGWFKLKELGFSIEVRKDSEFYNKLKEMKDMKEQA